VIKFQRQADDGSGFVRGGLLRAWAAESRDIGEALFDSPAPALRIVRGDDAISSPLPFEDVSKLRRSPLWAAASKARRPTWREP
jgi:hypothetical protein